MPKLCRKVLLGLVSNRILSVENDVANRSIFKHQALAIPWYFFFAFTRELVVWTQIVTRNWINQSGSFDDGINKYPKLQILHNDCAWNCFSVTAPPTVKGAPAACPFRLIFGPAAWGWCIHPWPRNTADGLHFLLVQRIVHDLHSPHLENKQWNMWNIKHNMRWYVCCFKCCRSGSSISLFSFVISARNRECLIISKKNWFEQWQCFKGIREEHMVVFCGLWMPKSQVFSGKDQETPKTPRFVPFTFGPAHLVDVSCKSPKIG